MDGGEAPHVDVRVIRIRESRTIAHPSIKKLIMRAVERTRYPATTPQRFYDETSRRIMDGLLGVFAGFTGWRCIEGQVSEPRALAIVSLPNSETMWAPVVNLAYSEDRELSVMIGARVREWVQRSGYDRILGMNLYHDDEAFCRTFRHVGEPRVVGSIVEVRL